MLKVYHLYMFARRRANGKFAAPPIGEIYRAEKIFRQISIQLAVYYQTAKIHISSFFTFPATGGQNGNKRQKPDFVGFARNPALL